MESKAVLIKTKKGCLSTYIYSCVPIYTYPPLHCRPQRTVYSYNTYVYIYLQVCRQCKHSIKRDLQQVWIFTPRATNTELFANLQTI